MIQATKEFIKILDDIYGVYLDSTSGFRLWRDEVIKAQNYASEITGKGIKDLENVRFRFFNTDPHKPDSHILHRSTYGQIKRRNEKEGDNYAIIANLCIVLIFQYWDSHYRKQISEELGLKKENDLKSDIMGDLNKLRNSIIHHQAIALKDVEKCILLKWFKEGDTIYINSGMLEKVIVHIKEYIIQINQDST